MALDSPNSLQKKVKLKSRNLWVAISLTTFIVLIFLVTISKLSKGGLIEGFDHSVRPSLVKGTE